MSGTISRSFTVRLPPASGPMQSPRARQSLPSLLNEANDFTQCAPAMNCVAGGVFQARWQSPCVQKSEASPSRGRVNPRCS